jgi:hypothetical protein
MALYDRVMVESLLLKQYGLITRTQALGCGLTESALHHRLRRGRTWQVMLPGVYLSSTGVPTGPQCVVAAQLYAGPESVITGVAALSAHGVHRPDGSDVDVLVPAARIRRSVRFARVHRTRRMPESVQTVGPIRYAPVARAVADAVRDIDDIAGVRAVVAGAVQRGKVRIGELASELAAGPAAGSAQFREVLREVADGVRSAAEAELRTLVRRERLPSPVFNPTLYAGGTFLAVPDAWWPQAGVAAEVESREWHLSPGDWERTMARHSRMSAHGIIVLHYPPRRLRAEPRVIAAEIRAAIAGGRPLPAVRVMAPATSAS